MRCIHCRKEVIDLEPHGPGICCSAMHHQHVEQIDDDEFRLYEGTPAPSGIESFVTLTRSEVKHLTTILSSALGWTAGPDLRLNPSNLPTRQDLYNAVEKMQVGYETYETTPETRRMFTTLALLEQYIAWLPGEHRVRAEADLRFMQRRVEELILCYDMIRKFRAIFTGTILRPTSAQEMFNFITSFVRALKERTGVDLWE
jgi:hypothetical protein